MQQHISNDSNTIHLVANSKGGVGKSFVCWNIAEYLFDKGAEFYGADTDPSTPTFLHYSPFNVKHINIADSKMRINRIKFDQLYEDILNHAGPCVIDSGSSTFLSLMDYLRAEKITENFSREGRRFLVHSPLVCGQMFDHTVRSLQSVLQYTKATVCVWENEMNGPVLREGTQFTGSALYQQYKERILGPVKIHERDADTYGPLVQNMTSQHLTYREMLERGDILTIQKQRIRNIRDDIFDQLAEIGL
jgi:hypothetical protein